MSESFSFSVNKGQQTLGGTLLMPKNFKPNAKVVVGVMPPIALDRYYGGLYKSIGEALAKKGIAVLLYNNRAYCDSTLAMESVTMFDQVDDARDAIAALRRDSR